ncbi:hypothetical protein [Streptomyces sp. S1D4-20]|uniref:hypothetical protein n=1 Tax=Streptomyces sp. S1D4-20 TaxID=2594462 RepID=UPI001164C2CD|nr:hypothetical protein [Streptomyces sp. S1D4-20]QDN54200.1 hypothetical protein FNV67_01115 [Streptomyces sp. S1D4-20]
MHHRVALERVLRVQAAMDAVSVPGTFNFDLVYLDALVRRFAAEQGYPPALWEVRESRSLADWEGQREVLVSLLEELMAGLRHWADHVPGEATSVTSGRAWAERLQGGLALLSIHAPGAVPDPAAFVESAIEHYRGEVSVWQALPDPPEEDRALISLSRSGAPDEPVRAEVYSDPVSAVLEFLHRDRPGHRVRVQLHEPGRPAQSLPVADLWQRAVRSSTLGAWHLVDSYRLQWLRHRLAGSAPAAHYSEGSTVRDRWAAAAVDWALTFGTSFPEADVVAALDQDASPHDDPAWQVLDEYRPVRAGELSAPGPIERPVPADWRPLTEKWSARALKALAIGEAPLERDTSELASAFAVLEPMRGHPDRAAGQVADDVLSELTWRFPQAQRLRVLLGPEESDVEESAELADNPYLAPAVLGPDRQRMRDEADQQARQLTAEHYALTSDSAVAAEAELLVQTMLRPPDDVLSAVASAGAGREVDGTGPRRLRKDPYGERWRAEHPRSAAALTSRSMEAARAFTDTPAGRAPARGAYARARTNRLKALHAMLGRLQAHRPDPVARGSWTEPRSISARASEVEQMLDRAAVLAVFPTFRSAHLHMDGVIATLHQQITQTVENLAQASRSLNSGGEPSQDLSAQLYASRQLRHRAVELRSLIEACDRLDEISPATVPTFRLSHQQLYADAEKIMLGEAQPAAPSARRELSQHHGTGQEVVHQQEQRFTGRQR